MGATVLLHGRDEQRCQRAVQQVREATGNDRAQGYLADFASLEQVRRLADRVTAEHETLDALVNNAGVGGGPDSTRAVSDDGLELRFQVNYLAHFLLTHLLLPRLRQSAPSRIVNVASAGQSRIDFNDMMLERSYDGSRAYGQSKLAQILFTIDLAGQLEGTGVTVNALHPATLMDTKMVLETFGRSSSTVRQGADAVVRLVTDPGLDGASGRYFYQQRDSHPDEQAYEPGARRRLRERSERLVDL